MVQDRGCTRLNIYFHHNFFKTVLHSVSEKSDFVLKKKKIVHVIYQTLWYAGFRTIFVSVVPSKLSWGHTLEVFVQGV